MHSADDVRLWYKENTVNLGWLEKPSRHQLRWRLHNNRWVTASRQFSSGDAVRKVLAAHGPRDVYIGTSAWLSPLDLPKRSDTEAPQPVLIDHLVVFDIDERPFSYRRLERARKIAHQLLAWLERNENLRLLCISYSGGKGFHLILRDNDRTLFSIPSPREREEAIQAARQALLDRVLANGFPVDETVTADTRRIIRLPGSLHGTTGWACTQLTREQLGQPLKQWVATLPRHRYAKKIPYWPYSLGTFAQNTLKRWSSLARRKKASINAHAADPLPTTTTFQVSTQVVGTKHRSAFLAWIPPRWQPGQIQAVGEQLKRLGWGPVYRFTTSGKTLLIAPRAIPKEQLQNVVRSMGWPAMASQIKALGHAWVDMAPAKPRGRELEEEFHYIGIWQAAGEGGSKAPWSATHLELLRRFGVDLAELNGEIAGRAEPAVRMVTKM